MFSGFKLVRLLVNLITIANNQDKLTKSKFL